MSVNIGGNILFNSGFTINYDVNDKTVVTDGLILWYDAGNFASRPTTTSNYYDCGYGCQYYGSDPGCVSCGAKILDMSGKNNDAYRTSGNVNIQYTGKTGGEFIFSQLTSDILAVSGLTSSCVNSMTWEMWVKIPYHTNYDRVGIFGNYNYPATGVSCFVYTGTTTQIYIAFNMGHGGATITGNSSGNISAGAWHHIVFAQEFASSNTYITSYTDGVFYSTETGTSRTPSYGTKQFALGDSSRDLSYYYSFQGGIAVWRVYNRTLTAAEAKNNFDAERQRFGI